MRRSGGCAGTSYTGNGQAAYDRILERCAPILFAGKNFREENAGATRQAAKDIVNRKHE